METNKNEIKDMPCRVGDTVYWVPDFLKAPTELKVVGFGSHEDKNYVALKDEYTGGELNVAIDAFGKKVFTSQQELVEKMKEEIVSKIRQIDPMLKTKLAGCEDVCEAMVVVSRNVPCAFDDWTYLAGFLTGLLGIYIEDPEVDHDYKGCKMLLHAFLNQSH